VVINRRHLDRPWAEVLQTLLHEMLHQWQHHHGQPSRRHHNEQYRLKAQSLGIPCDARGVSLGIVAGSAFAVLLQGHGITVATGPVDAGRAAIRGPGSKLKKWRCGCTNVRCAVELTARCERCGERFVRAGVEAGSAALR
jgi:hypothetical protein